MIPNKTNNLTIKFMKPTQHVAQLSLWSGVQIA